jgi:hypothetical protein
MDVRKPTRSRLHRLPSFACTDLPELSASLSSFGIRSVTLLELLETHFLVGEGARAKIECETLYTMSAQLDPFGFRKTTQEVVIMLYVDMLTRCCKLVMIIPVDDQDDDGDDGPAPAPETPFDTRQLTLA